MGDDTRERGGTPEGSTSNRDEPPIRFRGDEPELYLAYNHVLNGLIRRDVGAAPEDIEDACQFAWIQFFRYQPIATATGGPGSTALPRERRGVSPLSVVPKCGSSPNASPRTWRHRRARRPARSARRAG